MSDLHGDDSRGDDSQSNTANSGSSSADSSPESAEQPQQSEQQAPPQQAVPQQAPPQQAPVPPGQPFSPPGPGFGPGPPRNNLGWAIASMLLFWPLGIVSIVKMSEVHGYWALGLPQQAEHSASEAKKWGKIGVIVGACLTGLSIVLMFVYFIVIFAYLGTMRHM